MDWTNYTSILEVDNCRIAPKLKASINSKLKRHLGLSNMYLPMQKPFNVVASPVVLASIVSSL